MSIDIYLERFYQEFIKKNFQPIKFVYQMAFYFIL